MSAFHPVVDHLAPRGCEPIGQGGDMRKSASAGRAATVALCSAILLIAQGAAAQGWAHWELTQAQPDIAFGGRVNTIAMNPANAADILVASETGGLFRSGDGGINWQHVDSFGLYETFAVAFVPGAPNIILATAADRFTAATTGGIWRSVDSGATWSHVDNPPAPGFITSRFDAGEISIAPDTGQIYVATSWGVYFSSDQGATWAFSSVYYGQPVRSVLAQGGNVVLAGGDYGLLRSTDGGWSWYWPLVQPGPIIDLHAFARSPVSAGQAYVVNVATALFATDDAGLNWQRIQGAPAAAPDSVCGGNAFVKAAPATVTLPGGHVALQWLQLYFGNRCDLFHLLVKPVPGTKRFDYSGVWQKATLAHYDTRDLALSTAGSPKAVLLGTDGGLLRPVPNAMNWTMVGGGHHGYNALQVTEVKGQWIDDTRYDIFFGTQDNNLWASSDGGISWNEAGGGDSFYVQAQRRVGNATDSHITANLVCLGKCDGNQLFDAALTAPRDWANPPNSEGCPFSNPVVVAKSFHVQRVCQLPFDTGLAVTRDLGKTWFPFAPLPEFVQGLPKLSRWKQAPVPVLYQSFKVSYDGALGFEIDQLARVTKALKSNTAVVEYPAMNGFGGLGFNPTMFAWYPVFGVDPTDSRNLMAPDVVNQKMMHSSDGGESWSDMPALTSLVTDGGRLEFANGAVPLASAISYNPDDPALVAVGTHQNGLMLSTDRGQTWAKVAGADRATYITSIEWSTASDALVSTYGRGLWRLKGEPWIPSLTPLCTIIGCQFQFVDRGDPAPGKRFERGIVALDGRIVGARVNGGRLEELFVTAGTTAASIQMKAGTGAVKVTVSARRIGLVGRTQGRLAWPRDQQRSVVAIAIDEDGRVVGLATAEKRIAASQALGDLPTIEVGALPELAPGTPTSPHRSRPYLTMTAAGAATAGALAPGDYAELRGVRFMPGTALRLNLDGQDMASVTTDGKGAFSLAVPVPARFGAHRIVVRQGTAPSIIDGVTFNVAPIDADRPVRTSTEAHRH